LKRTLTLLIPFLVLAGCSHEKTPTYIGIAEGTVVQVPALSGGKLSTLNVDEGKAVTAGTVVAIVDTMTLHYQVQELDASLREIAVQRDIQSTQVRQAQTDLSYIDDKYKRNEQLAHAQTIPGQTLDDLGNLRDKSMTQLAAASRQNDVLSAREAQLQAKRRQLRKAIDDAVIRAPESGIVSVLYTRLGEAAVPMKPILEITALDTVETTVYVPESKLPSVKTGQTVKIKLDGDASGLTGTVSWISPKAEFTPKQVLTPDNRTALVYGVRLRIPNPDGKIKHGMPVEVEL
jgi:HlyD family secretion protein